MNSLVDQNKGLLNFNIQGTNGKCFNFLSSVAAKVISNRPAMGITGATPGSTIADVGAYGSNPNIGGD